jgi:hypothetical protein
MYLTLDGRPRDFLDMLMDIEKTERDLFATPDDIKYLLKDLVLAGSDTTAATIEWLILLLCQNPEAQQKVAYELRTVIKNVDEIKYSTFTEGKLPYLEAAIKEVRVKVSHLNNSLMNILVHENDACRTGLATSNFKRYDSARLSYTQRRK